MTDWERWGRCRLMLLIGLALLTFVSYLLGDLPSMYSSFFTARRRPQNVTSRFEWMAEEGGRREGYLVWSASCRIPDIPAMDESIRSLVNRPKPVLCSGRKLSRMAPGRRLTLHPSLGSSQCCYSTIQRLDLEFHGDIPPKDADNKFTLSDCKNFKNWTEVPEDVQSVRVKCTKKKGKEIYSNVHSFIGKMESVEEKIKLQENMTGSKNLSVLLIGVDSISRLNMLRTMPNTTSYLDSEGWINYNGYNKIDDNTFPNLMAVLTGMTTTQVMHSCFPSPKHAIDGCPFLWKDYSKKGYISAYGEDEPIISSFNYHKTGFHRAPTDFYMRPFMLAASKYTKIKTQDSLSLCLGPSYSVDHILDYAINLASSFSNALYFALFWMNTFSHNDLNRPASFDKALLRFFKELEKSGTLNSTLVVFLSDHGMRFGKIRETYLGWLEERLPFIYFWVPPWFRKEWPEKYANLVSNKDKLTSPFDLHLTLKELIGESTAGTPGCKNCVSLFSHVPWNRTCSDAGITGHWCTCAEYENLSTDVEEGKLLVAHLVGELNRLAKRGESHASKGWLCAKLKPHRVLSIRSKLFDSGSQGQQELVVVLETEPGRALFEATLSALPSGGFTLLDTISRINSYQKQSQCVDDAYLQKYCFCQRRPSSSS